MHSRAAEESATQNPSSDSITNFYIGQTYFPKGDSIEITSVERSATQMTVIGKYNLISCDQAEISLYITTTNNNDNADTNIPEAFNQTKPIFKGRRYFVLMRSHLVPGLPHVNMYPTNGGHPFAELYFGTKAEAAEEGKLNLHSDFSFGPVVERILFAGRDQDSQLLCLDDGTLVVMPAKENTASATDLTDWWRGTKADLAVAVIGQKIMLSSLKVGGAKFAEVPASDWELASSTDVTEAIQKGSLHRPIVSGFDEVVLPESVALPATFAVESRTGKIGLLQITGFTENPHGVKIRYKLVQRMPDTGTQDPQPGSSGQSTQIPSSMIFSSAGGKVVLETKGGTLTADRVEFSGTNTLKATNVRMTSTNNAPVR